VSDADAFLDVQVAARQRVPDLSGTGSFQLSGTEPVGHLRGSLYATGFVGRDPANEITAPTAPLRVALLGTSAVTLPLVGAHVKFAAAVGGLMQGEIHGALRKADLDAVLVPALAHDLDELAHDPACPAECKTARKLFDTGPVDGSISEIEVTTSAVLGKLLIPDIQLYDGQGNWSPNPSNTTPDSFTIGVGFTGRPARITP
jgi:hypothetical protein